jgi:hypothetical protein
MPCSVEKEVVDAGWPREIGGRLEVGTIVRGLLHNRVEGSPGKHFQSATHRPIYPDEK